MMNDLLVELVFMVMNCHVDSGAYGYAILRGFVSWISGLPRIYVSG
jgi:hypothetical protein